jgi:carbamate kinase
MLVVVALGGNALLRRGEAADVDTQRGNVSVAVDALAALARRHRLVVTHGNGPQVGLLALQADRDTSPYPLDVLGAESEGMIGYLLEQGLHAKLDWMAAGTLLTQVIVDPDDPAFAHPSKPIGPIYDRVSAERLAAERGWTVGPDRSGGAEDDRWRRLVPSPEPRKIVELQTIRVLLDAGVLVICAGGGGIPVLADEHGALRGVEAAIDKDRSAALLARELGADALLLLTDVSSVQRGFGTRQAQPIREAAIDELDPADFATGSMRPKIEATCRFVRETGGLAAIGALADAERILAGEAGTRIVARTDVAQRRLERLAR